MFEDAVFSLFEGSVFSSPISGIMIVPRIMDDSIAPIPLDHVGYDKRDDSVSVGIKIDFALWERSSEFERVGLLADNIRCSLNKIESHYLMDADRERLNSLVDTVKVQLGAIFAS